MKDVVRMILSVYLSLKAAAPGSDAGKRFLNDCASWGLFMLVARLMRRVERPTPETERTMLALASIAGCGYRAGGADWLDDQFARISLRLLSPTPRERLVKASDEWALDQLSDAIKAKARDIQARAAVTNAAANEKLLPGALDSAKAYLTSANVFSKDAALLPALLGNADTDALLKKIRTSINDAPAASLAFGDAMGATLIARWIESGELQEILEPYEPAFDDAWVAAHEIASQGAADAADEDRARAELDAIQAEVKARTGGDSEPLRFAEGGF